METLFVSVVEFLGRFGYWGVFVGMALESACVPLPSEIVLPFGGYLAATGQITFVEAVIAGQVGGMVGSVAAYTVGLMGGRRFLERFGKYVLISSHELAVADNWFNRWGEWTVFLSRMLPGVRTFISLPAGIAGMNFPRFLFYSFVGMLPWSFAFTYAGYRLGQNWGAVRDQLHRYDLLVIVLFSVALAWFLWHKLRHRHA